MKFKTILLLGFVISFALVLLNSFLYFHTMKSYNEISGDGEVSDTVIGGSIELPNIVETPMKDEEIWISEPRFTGLDGNNYSQSMTLQLNFPLQSSTQCKTDKYYMGNKLPSGNYIINKNYKVTVDYCGRYGWDETTWSQDTVDGYEYYIKNGSNDYNITVTLDTFYLDAEGNKLKKNITTSLNHGYQMFEQFNDDGPLSGLNSLKTWSGAYGQNNSEIYIGLHGKYSECFRDGWGYGTLDILGGKWIYKDYDSVVKSNLPPRMNDVKTCQKWKVGTGEYVCNGAPGEPGGYEGQKRVCENWYNQANRSYESKSCCYFYDDIIPFLENPVEVTIGFNPNDVDNDGYDDVTDIAPEDPDVHDYFAITFLSTKSLYRSGENLDFEIYVDNQGDEFIPNIDFAINVRSLSIFDFKIFTKNHYSDRGFKANSVEIIRIGSRGHMDVALPGITPSGSYELELVATPENKKTLQPAKVKMFVIQDPIYLYLYIFGMVLFFVLYAVQITYSNIIKGKTIEAINEMQKSKIYYYGLMEGKKKEAINEMQKSKIYYYGLMEGKKKETISTVHKPFYFFLSIIAKYQFLIAKYQFLFLYRIRITWYKLVEGALPLINEFKELNQMLKASFAGFSVGQKFVFGGICLLLSTAVLLSVGLSMFADKFAILAYYSLVIGVLNILFENFQESKDSKISINVNFPLRTHLSLLIFIFLIIFSISEFGIIMALASIGALIAISAYLILGGKRTDLS